MKLYLFILFCMFSVSTSFASGERGASGSTIQMALDDAASEYGIPLPILKAIAEIESHSVHRIRQDESDSPRAYGVMGLRDDDYFGHSLRASAQLLKINEQQLITDYRANIRGASAYLKQIAEQKAVHTQKLANWKAVLAVYSGIPSEEAAIYADQVLKAAQNSLPHFETASAQKFVPQINWSPSPNFGGTLRPQYIVLHTTEGSYAASLAWFKNPNSHVSSHYLIRSSDGAITQMVSDENVAWHARCWNDNAIGIEHEAISTDGSGLTPALYQSSSMLVRYLAQKFNIPLDANHIIGHDFWQTEQFKQSPLGDCQDHNDPGKFWDWNRYFLMLMGRNA